MGKMSKFKSKGKSKMGKMKGTAGNMGDMAGAISDKVDETMSELESMMLFIIIVGVFVFFLPIVLMIIKKAAPDVGTIETIEEEHEQSGSFSVDRGDSGDRSVSIS